MKRKVLALVVIALAISPGISSAESFKRINKEKDFLAAVGGKKLSAEWGWIKLTADGKMTGKNNTQGKVNGAWKWSGRFWCRNFVMGGQEYGTDCQKIMKSGKVISFTRNKGKGNTILMELD